MPKLSIIVPVYNAEAYLNRCVDSILGQTFMDFELILVDDGSPDHCGQIINEYAAKDVRVLGVHQENRGVSEARNHGLRLASGDYIGFVDADDWIEPDMYQTMVSSMENNNVDIVSCMFFDDYPDGIQQLRSNIRIKGLISGADFMGALYDEPITIGNSACMKLFKRDLIKIGFEEGTIICEDNLFLAHYCLNVKSGFILSDCLYHVFINSKSSTRNELGKQALGLASREKIIAIAERKGRDCKEKAEKVFINACMRSMKENSVASEYYKEARSKFNSYLCKNPRSVMSNKYINIKTKLFYYYIALTQQVKR